jgi:UPF0716 protein FxsA
VTRVLLPFLLLVVPLTEIAVFILVGGAIGVLPTIGLVLLTATAGTVLLRIQGFGVIRRIRQTLDAGRLPGHELAHGAMILAAGLLLLTPGFVTDTIGLLLFVPAMREAVAAFIIKHVIIVTQGPEDSRPFGPRGADTIELGPEDYSARTEGSSPWRRGS